MVAFLCVGPLLLGPLLGYLAFAFLEWRDDRRTPETSPPDRVCP